MSINWEKIAKPLVDRIVEESNSNSKSNFQVVKNDIFDYLAMDQSASIVLKNLLQERVKLAKIKSDLGLNNLQGISGYLDSLLKIRQQKSGDIWDILSSDKKYKNLNDTQKLEIAIDDDLLKPIVDEIIEMSRIDNSLSDESLFEIVRDESLLERIKSLIQLRLDLLEDGDQKNNLQSILLSIPDEGVVKSLTYKQKPSQEPPEYEFVAEQFDLRGVDDGFFDKVSQELDNGNISKALKILWGPAEGFFSNLYQKFNNLEKKIAESRLKEIYDKVMEKYLSKVFDFLASKLDKADVGFDDLTNFVLLLDNKIQNTENKFTKLGLNIVKQSTRGFKHSLKGFYSLMEFQWNGIRQLDYLGRIKKQIETNSGDYEAFKTKFRSTFGIVEDVKSSFSLSVLFANKFDLTDKGDEFYNEEFGDVGDLVRSLVIYHQDFVDARDSIGKFSDQFTDRIKKIYSNFKEKKYGEKISDNYKNFGEYLKKMRDGIKDKFSRK